MGTSPQIKVLEAQIKQCYIWTGKVHEQCVAILPSRKSRRTQYWSIILSVLTSLTALLGVATNSRSIYFAGTGFSLFTLILLMILLQRFKLGTTSQSHAQATSSIWNVHEKYLSLLVDIRSNILSVEEIRRIREQLQNELHRAYKSSPETLSTIFDETARVLNEVEQPPDCNEETDRFYRIFNNHSAS